ncbi:hypothetical protein [Altererythrobacter sp.]|uniref:hypothetical protein n=1 Tax=Altererythrobacter sp. TaxID=1872480 RepID=UPI003D00D020
MLSKRHFDVGSGIADFWSEFKKPQPYRWPILVASSVPIVLILIWAIGEETFIPPEGPKVSYITSFAPGRSDTEIAASNLENQKRQDELRAERERIEEQKKEMYRELGRASGMDVDAMEAQIEADRQREEAARAARSSGEAAPDGPVNNGDTPVADPAE